VRARGFTLAEMAIVLSCAAILLPIVYGLGRHLEDQSELARWELGAARAARTVSEELRRDAALGVPVAGEPGAWAMGPCKVRYRVDAESVLIREGGPGCGADRGLARDVEALRPVPGGWELLFVRRLRPSQARRLVVFLPWGAP